MTTLALKAPLSGFLMPIEQVPDEVFSTRALGDGIALDPITNAVLAPCNGRIVQLHDAHHALTIATPSGIKVMIHVGLDTVYLNGEGFQAHVQVGDKVETGQMLIEFDPDFVAQRAPSLLTMIVIMDSEDVLSFGKARGAATATETVILDLKLKQGGGGSAGDDLSDGSGDATSRQLLILNQLGLHARPAAVLANLARQYKSEIRLLKGKHSADAKSITSLMNLDLAFRDEITLEALGPDAAQAIQALSRVIELGLGEEGAKGILAPASISRAAIDAPAPRLHSSDPNILFGVTTSPGLAVGNIHQLRRRLLVLNSEAVGDVAGERAALDKALNRSITELQVMQARLQSEGSPAQAALYAVQEELLHDPVMLASVDEKIDTGSSAAFAWETTINSQAARLEKVSSELLASRAEDLREAGRRLLAHLPGVESELVEQPVNTILIAGDLSPADIAAVNRDRVIGLATTLGGATSQASILARSLDMPAIAGIEGRALDIVDGTPIILDATRAKIHLNPSKEEIAYVVGMLRKRKQKRKTDRENVLEAAVTTDGHHMQIAANLSAADSAEQAIDVGADGIGLLRTEALFLERGSAPDESEQAETYASIAGILGDAKPLIIRTLDLGSAGPPAYLPITPQSNPFLGERGIRAGLARPYLLRTQIRAILRASAAGGNMHIILPMIAALEEWRMAKALIDEEVKNLGLKSLPVGIMVSTPAAAIMAEQFAREADFFSIDSNDLAQYVLGMDRDHPALAAQIDALNPAVLRLIAQTTAGAQKHSRWVGVCGSMASDPQAVPILMGLGVKQLSAAVPTVPTIKALIRALSLEDARKRARYALTLESAADVRDLYPLQDYEL